MEVKAGIETEEYTIINGFLKLKEEERRGGLRAVSNWDVFSFVLI